MNIQQICKERFQLQKEFQGQAGPIERPEPLVSVCVATYQHVNFIRQCLDGILMQKASFPFEIILGEDESTDGTREICIEYATKFPLQIRLFLRDRQLSQLNDKTGKFVTMFNGRWNSMTAKGKYIALCEGDDYWTNPYKLQKQVDFLEANKDFYGCFHLTQLIEEDGTVSKIVGEDVPDIMTTIDTITLVSPFHTSSFIARKDALVIPDWLSGIISKDMAIFSIVTAKGPLKRFPEIMSVYRKHGGGITSSEYVLTHYHQDRIKLANYLNAFHGFKYNDKASYVVSYHKKALAFKMRESKSLRGFFLRILFRFQLLAKELKSRLPFK